MLLSILIPVYNSEKYIAKCLESIIRQNLQEGDYEVLLIDDGSTDASFEIIQEYATANTAILATSIENVGVYAARNKLLDQARGDYVYFMDADDYLVDDAIPLFLNIALQQNPEVIGFKTLETFDYTNNKTLVPFENITTPKAQEGISFMTNHGNMRHEIWWYFIKKEFLTSHKIFFDEAPFSADVMFTLTVFQKAKKVIFVPISVYRYVQTKNSITRSKEDKHRLKVIECQSKMVVNFSVFINELEVSEHENYELLQNLKFRRDTYLFFLIIRMIRSKVRLKQFQQQIALFESHNAYPIKHFIGDRYTSHLYRTLNFLFNIKFLLYCIIGVNHVVRPKK